MNNNSYNNDKAIYQIAAIHLFDPIYRLTLSSGLLRGNNLSVGRSVFREALKKDPTIEIRIIKSPMQQRIDQYLEGNCARYPFTKRCLSSINRFFTAYPPCYSPADNLVINTPISRYGTLAHELGHALQKESPLMKNTFSPLYQKGCQSATILILTSVLLNNLSNDEEAKQFSSALLSIALMPMVIYEFDASYRGSKLLSKINSIQKQSLPLRIKARFLPFSGVPTYMMSAIYPYLYYTLRERIYAK